MPSSYMNDTHVLTRQHLMPEIIMSRFFSFTVSSDRITRNDNLLMFDMKLTHDSCNTM